MDISKLTVKDIFYLIALDLRAHFATHRLDAVKNLLASNQFDIGIAITTDIIETEFDFVSRYGIGHSYNFSLSCYEQGKDLAAEFHQLLYGIRPDLSAHTGAGFRRNELLYLFIHIRNLSVPKTSSRNINYRSTDAHTANLPLKNMATLNFNIISL